jgi:hypothetical protein
MSGKRVASYLSLNRNLRSESGELRFYELSRTGLMPQLAPPSTGAHGGGGGGARRAGSNVPVTIIDGSREVPEMMSDLINVSTSYAVSNVKRGDGRTQGPWTKVGFALLREKVLGGQRAIRL